MDEATPTGKRELLESLLEKGMVMVVLDARRPGVSVPAHLARDPQLRLNLSWRFGFLMELDAWGVKATLTFGGSPFTCRLPWTAIYAMVSHASKDEQFIFPGELPEELQRLAAGELDDEDEAAEEGPEASGEPVEGKSPAEPPAVARRGHLAVVEGGSPPPAPEAPSETAEAPQAEPSGEGPGDREPPPPGGPRPFLRLVK